MTPLKISDFTPYTGEMVALLRRLAEIESPTTDKPAVDRLGAALAEELHALGAAVTVHPQPTHGDHIEARFAAAPGAPSENAAPILVLCHMDTVHELGTLQRFPVREELTSQPVLRGPGVFDMKGGIAVFLSAMRRLRQVGGGLAALPRPVLALFTSDEETGSESSRSLIEARAQGAAAAFVMEPAMNGGALKTSRKGTGEIIITAHGRAAHAGSDHARGRNAIEELAHHILSVQKLTDYGRGTTTNVGIVQAGSRTNVVPDEAVAQVDFRISTSTEVERLREWAAGLQPVISGCTVQATVTTNRPPMPRDATMVLAYQKAQTVARQLGLELPEAASGGASNADFVAPLGTPILDGLGVRGDGAHSEGEFMYISSLPERAALLAALLTQW